MRTGTEAAVSSTNAPFSISASREAITGIICMPATRTTPSTDRTTHTRPAVRRWRRGLMVRAAPRRRCAGPSARPYRGTSGSVDREVDVHALLVVQELLDVNVAEDDVVARLECQSQSLVGAAGRDLLDLAGVARLCQRGVVLGDFAVRVQHQRVCRLVGLADHELVLLVAVVRDCERDLARADGRRAEADLPLLH